MKKERERKFLVTKNDLKRAQQPQIFRIHDLYFEPAHEGTPPLRLRRCFCTTSGDSRVFTAKIGPAGDVDEHEWLWPARLPGFDIPLGVAPEVDKLRDEWREGELLFHIEELIHPKSPKEELIAEVEFPSVEARDAFVPPDHWIEITGDPRYSNYSLAKHGWP